MIVPLLLGCALRNAAPGLPESFGSFTGALFTGALPILAVFYVCMGATISLEATPFILRKGGVLLGSKILCGLIVGAVLDTGWERNRLKTGFLPGFQLWPWWLP